MRPGFLYYLLLLLEMYTRFFSLLIFKGGGKLAKKFKTRDYIEEEKMGTTFQLRFKKTLNPGIGVYSTLAQCYFDRI